MLHNKARRSLLGPSSATAGACSCGILWAGAADGHHCAVHIISEAQQQAGAAPAAPAAAANATGAAHLRRAAACGALPAALQVRVWGGRLLCPGCRLLQVACQQLVGLARERVHQAQQGLLPRLPLRLLLPVRLAAARRAARRRLLRRLLRRLPAAARRGQGKGEQCAGGLGAHGTNAIRPCLPIQVRVLLVRQGPCSSEGI